RRSLGRGLADRRRGEGEVLAGDRGRDHRGRRTRDRLGWRRNLDLRRELDRLEHLRFVREVLGGQLGPECEGSEVKHGGGDHRAPEPRAKRILESIVRRGGALHGGYCFGSAHRLSLCMLCSNCAAKTTRTTPASTSSFWTRSMIRYGTSRSPRNEMIRARSDCA